MTAQPESFPLKKKRKAAWNCWRKKEGCALLAPHTQSSRSLCPDGSRLSELYVAEMEELSGKHQAQVLAPSPSPWGLVCCWTEPIGLRRETNTEATAALSLNPARSLAAALLDGCSRGEAVAWCKKKLLTCSESLMSHMQGWQSKKLDAACVSGKG